MYPEGVKIDRFSEAVNFTFKVAQDFRPPALLIGRLLQGRGEIGAGLGDDSVFV